MSESSGTADALKALAAVAPEVAITELDIAGASAADYNAVTQACLDLENCVGITVWGAYLRTSLYIYPSPLTLLQVFPTPSHGGPTRTPSSSTQASSPRRPTLRSPPFSHKSRHWERVRKLPIKAISMLILLERVMKKVTTMALFRSTHTFTLDRLESKNHFESGTQTTKLTRPIDLSHTRNSHPYRGLTILLADVLA